MSLVSCLLFGEAVLLEDVVLFVLLFDFLSFELGVFRLDDAGADDTFEVV